MHQMLMLRNCAKALGLTIVREGPNDLWTRRPKEAAEFVFNPFTHQVQVWQLVHACHVDIQWGFVGYRRMVRARIQNTQWNAWTKDPSYAVVEAVALWIAGNYERMIP